MSVVYWKKTDCPIRTEPSTIEHQEAIAVRRYLENTNTCRRQWLLDYFDPAYARPGNDPQNCCNICADL